MDGIKKQIVSPAVANDAYLIMEQRGGNPTVSLLRVLNQMHAEVKLEYLHEIVESLPFNSQEVI